MTTKTSMNVNVTDVDVVALRGAFGALAEARAALTVAVRPLALRGWSAAAIGRAAGGHSHSVMPYWPKDVKRKPKGGPGRPFAPAKGEAVRRLVAAGMAIPDIATALSLSAKSVARELTLTREQK